MKKSMMCGLVFLFVVGLVGIFLTDEASAQIRPAYTKNVDEPGRQPLEIWAEFSRFRCNFNCSNFAEFGNVFLFDLAPVPAGKRWVIQSVSGRLPTGSTDGHVALQSSRVVSLQFIKWAFFGPFFKHPSADIVGFHSEAFTTYGPGEVPHINILAPDASNFITSITVSGYLIDAN